MYDLVSIVGHVNDTTLDGSDDNNDNLVAHIRVAPSYHLRKEVYRTLLSHAFIFLTVCVETSSSQVVNLA